MWPSPVAIPWYKGLISGPYSHTDSPWSWLGINIHVQRWVLWEVLSQMWVPMLCSLSSVSMNVNKTSGNVRNRKQPMCTMRFEATTGLDVGLTFWTYRYRNECCECFGPGHAQYAGSHSVRVTFSFQGQNLPRVKLWKTHPGSQQNMMLSVMTTGDVGGGRAEGQWCTPGQLLLAQNQAQWMWEQKLRKGNLSITFIFQ